MLGLLTVSNPGSLPTSDRQSPYLVSISGPSLRRVCNSRKNISGNSLTHSLCVDGKTKGLLAISCVLHYSEHIYICSKPRNQLYLSHAETKRNISSTRRPGSRPELKFTTFGSRLTHLLRTHSFYAF